MSDWMQPELRRAASLSELIDWAAGEEGRRDELFVRTFAQFLHEHRDKIRFETVAALSLIDVVVTFKMKGNVTMIVTGTTADHPGELTWRVEETDFPYVRVSVGDEVAGPAYDFCTLDYSCQGRSGVVVRQVELGSMTLAVGTFVTALVVTTLGADSHLRVRINESGEQASLAPDAVRLL